MKILGLDFETTWSNPVNPNVIRVTEIGAVLVDWDTGNPIYTMSEYVWHQGYPASPKELVQLTGIQDETLEEFGLAPLVAFTNLMKLIGRADYVCAHNGTEFDKVVLGCELERLGVAPDEISWIDTKTDVPYPDTIKTTKLSYLCAEHGFVNPFKHRALFDALSMIKVLQMYDIEEVLELASQTTVYAIADVTYNEKHLAKERGYYWDGDNKQWYKAMKESRASIEKEQAPFGVQIARSK